MSSGPLFRCDGLRRGDDVLWLLVSTDSRQHSCVIESFESRKALEIGGFANGPVLVIAGWAIGGDSSSQTNWGVQLNALGSRVKALGQDTGFKQGWTVESTLTGNVLNHSTQRAWRIPAARFATRFFRRFRSPEKSTQVK